MSVVSAAFFCPRARRPCYEYVTELRSFLQRNIYGKALLVHVSSLDQVWPFFTNANSDIRSLSRGRQDLGFLVDFSTGGPVTPVCEVTAGLVALPLLLVLQLGQYFRYLEAHNLSHERFLQQTRCAGGIHGFCGGAAAALAVALAKDETEVVGNAAVLLRILMGVGATMEAAGDQTSSGPTTIVLRLKYEGQGEDLLKDFPGTYISAITEPKSISVVGPACTLAKLSLHAKSQGLPVHTTDLTGKAHNPENAHLAKEFLEFLALHPEFQLPKSCLLRTAVRSNLTGKRLSQETLLEDMVTMMLASRCDWYTLLSRVAEDLHSYQQSSHKLVVFGMDDCVPMSPFHKMQVKVSKFEARTLSFLGGNGVKPHSIPTECYQFPDTAVAIIGASCRLPGANNLDELWTLVSEGRDCSEKLPPDRLNVSDSFRVSQAGLADTSHSFYGNFIDIMKFDNSFFNVNAKEAANMDPQQRLLLELSYEALESSGYLATHVRERGDSVGCFIGASMVEYLDNTNAHTPTAYTSTGTIRGFLCGRLSYYYGWTGPSEIIDTACSSSLVAINRACSALSTGECKIALAGGVNAITGINNFLDLGKAGFLSPTGQCKAFDASADGYCRAEGAGLVVLKSLKQAITNNDHILGIIPSIATNQGGLSPSLTVPSSQALQSLYTTLLDRAGLLPSRISYIEAHATGTQAGDPIEMESIRTIFADSPRLATLRIGSIKGNIGHCETAAGVAGLLKVLVMIQHGSIPPQANYHTLNPRIPPLDYSRLEIPRTLSPWSNSDRIALVNSYGAGGSNCALLCCQVPKEITEPGPTATGHPSIEQYCILSAASVGSLISQAHTMARYLSERISDLKLMDVAHTLIHHRKRHKFCLEATGKELQDIINAFALATSPSFESPTIPKPVILVFGGQNGNDVDISLDLWNAYPKLRYYIDACDNELVRLGYDSLYPGIFQSSPNSNAFTQQCHLFAIQYAFARCWIDAGLKVTGIVGHSFGELTALVVSDALTLRDGIKLIASRAHLIHTAWGAEKGAMLAIHADSILVRRLIDQVKSILPGEGLDIACHNGPSMTIISGTSLSVDTADQVLSTDLEFLGTRFQRLSTTHAFHSSLVDPILPGLEDITRSIIFSEPKIPLEFCTDEALDSIKNWSSSRHAREPVFFCSAVRRIEQRLGDCVWLEAGQNTCAIPLARKAVTNIDSHAFHACSVKVQDDSFRVIGDIVSALWRHGSSLVHWSLLAARPKQVWLPPYQFEKGTHWIENVDRAMEAQRRLIDSLDAFPNRTIPLPKRLVSLVEADETTSIFLIDSQCERYRRLVEGHAVVGNPLCPASMYMECVAMAIRCGSTNYQNEDLASVDLIFEGLEISSPLGISSNRRITMQIDKTTSDTLWSFIIQSTAVASTSRPTIHCVGKVSVSLSASLATFTRLLGRPVERLRRSKTGERLLSTRAYGLFLKVVRYESFLQSISSITIDGNEAVATIQLAKNQPGRDESAAWDWCDAVLIDAFISVAGLLLNSSDMVSCKEVMVAVAVDHTIIKRSCTAKTPHPWQVYTTFISTDESHAMCDVFIYDSQNIVVAVLSGIRFTKVQLSKLEKTLSTLDRHAMDYSQNSGRNTAAPPLTKKALNTSDEDKIFAKDLTEVKGISPLLMCSEIKLKKLISEYIDMEATSIPLDVMLVDLGIDSLSSIELTSEMNKEFALAIDTMEIGYKTLADIIECLGGSSSSVPALPQSSSTTTSESIATPESLTSGSTPTADLLHQSHPETIDLPNPLKMLVEAESEFDSIALSSGFADYWSNVAPLQNHLLVSYILEAFENMGVDVISLPLDAPVPTMAYHSKHNRVIQRLWRVLQNQGIVEIQGTTWIRSKGKPILERSSHQHRQLVSQFPHYTPEAKLMQLVGEKLAECLRGHQDPVSLMFGTPASSKLMEDYYRSSPMLSSFTDLLVSFITRMLKGVNCTIENPLRILEVGAGTGGTTSRLIEALARSSIPCRYVFTDISPVLVAKAKIKFAKYPWIDFATFDLEQEVRHDFRSHFHIAISTNCVHATTSRVMSCQRLGETLTEDGILVLSEVTRVIDWYDLCFGLLDGWWQAGDGTEYPIQPAPVWMKTLSESGFLTSGYSKGSSEESTTQQLLVGSKRSWQGFSSLAPDLTLHEDPFYVKTMEYKIVDGTPIHADVYIPQLRRTKPLCIALMIHGGGHMTLSRKCIRPAQTRYLLTHGFLPVSIDYRLCPEVNLIDGPMTDVCDGYRWTKTLLTQELNKDGIAVDSERVVVIGWSSGGHLAMSLDWTTRQAGLPPPSSVLSFYAPVSFESNDVYRDAGRFLPQPSRSFHEIIKAMPRTPITSYNPRQIDETNLGWLEPGDIRSDLLLSVFKDGAGIPLLLNGLPKSIDLGGLKMPSRSEIDAIDPLAHLRRGRYTTPTFIIHGSLDSIAPHSAAEQFVDELKLYGVRHGFLSLKDRGHVFDVNLRQGTDEWDNCVAPGYKFLFESV